MQPAEAVTVGTTAPGQAGRYGDGEHAEQDERTCRADNDGTENEQDGDGELREGNDERHRRSGGRGHAEVASSVSGA